MPGKVKVKIISGRNLPVMDRSSDTTDAYVEIKLSTTTYKTDVCRKSLHPQWNSEWYRFELDDAELQDEPLQIRLMDHDTYSANDAIGKVYLDLNPLLLPATSLLGKWTDGAASHEASNSVMSGWIPVYDTMHGIRGEVNIVVKVELFTDFNKFRQSSCGVQFFCSPAIPHGFHAQVIHGFVEELVVNDDPEYQWIDKIRTPRASNEARQTLFCKLSGELQRRIGLKALEMGGNAVIGYNQCFDLEGESGIVARGIGTAVTLVKILDLPSPTPNADGAVNDERAQNYLQFLGSAKGFYLNNNNANVINQQLKSQLYAIPSPTASFRSLKVERHILKPEIMPQYLTRHLSDREFNYPVPIVPESSMMQHSVSLQTLLKQEDQRGRPGYGISQRFRNLKYTSQSMITRKMTALKARLGTDDGDGDGKRGSFKYRRTQSDNGGMAEILVRSVFHATTSLDCIAESPKMSSDEESRDRAFLSLPIAMKVPVSPASSCNSNASTSSADDDDDDDDDDDEDEEEEDEEAAGDTIAELDTVSHIVETVRKLSMIQSPIISSKEGGLQFEDNKFLFVIGDVGDQTASFDADGEEDANLLYYQDGDDVKSEESKLRAFEMMRKSATAISLSGVSVDLHPEKAHALRRMFTSLHNIHASESRWNKYSAHGGKETVLGELFHRIDSAHPLSHSDSDPHSEPDPQSVDDDNENPEMTEKAPEEENGIKMGLKRTKPLKLFVPPIGEPARPVEREEPVDSVDTKSLTSMLQQREPEKHSKAFLPKKVLQVLHKLDSKIHHHGKAKSNIKHEHGLLNIALGNVLLDSVQEVLATSHSTSPDAKPKWPEAEADAEVPPVPSAPPDEHMPHLPGHSHVLDLQSDDISQQSLHSAGSDEHEHRHGLFHKLKESKEKLFHAPVDLYHRIEDKIHDIGHHGTEKSAITNEHGLLNIALGNVLMDSVQEVLATSHTGHTASPNSAPPVFPTFADVAEVTPATQQTPGTPGTPGGAAGEDHRHSLLSKLKEGKDKLLHRFDTKIHHHAPSAGGGSTAIKSEHGLLNIALTNVLMDSVQEVLATSHSNTPTPQSLPQSPLLTAPTLAEPNLLELVLHDNNLNKVTNSPTSLTGCAVNTQLDGGARDCINTTHACLTTPRSVEPPPPPTVAVVTAPDAHTTAANTSHTANSASNATVNENGHHQRTESLGVRISHSPAKLNAIPCIHRRSSDSDLSITPKGNSLTGSDRSGGYSSGQYMRGAILRTTTRPQENFDIMEYPFLTLSKYPPGFIAHLGGSVSARSVKLLERISNLEEPESRDTWWSEIRMEIRSHARALNCNAVLGYTESTSICDDVCVLSASGTAAVLGLSPSVSEAADNVSGLPVLPKNNTTTMTTSLDRSDFEKDKDVKDKDKEKEKEKEKTKTERIEEQAKPNIRSTKIPSNGGVPVAYPVPAGGNTSPERESAASQVKSSCSISHLPYVANSKPLRSSAFKCFTCGAFKVPDMLIATIEIPDGMPNLGRGCFIQSYVCRPLKDLKGESNAKEISDGLPFLEYELHRFLINKLKVKGMNAIFGLKVRISVGERMLIGIATGTAVFLSSLPPPLLPKLVSDRTTDEKKFTQLQKNLHDTIRKNREIYQLRSIEEVNGESTKLLSESDDSEDENITLDLVMGNKDCCILEVDDPDDVDVLNSLMEPRPPDGFHVVNTEHVPGLEDLEIVKNLQMFTQIWRAKIPPPFNLDKHFHRLLQSVYFKLRRMIPCALCDLQFRVDSPEPDEIQLCVLGMALGLGDPFKNPKKRKTVIQKRTDDDLIFNLEEDQIPEHSVVQTPSTHLLPTQSLKHRQKSPIRSKLLTKQRHVPYRERHGVDITPLSYVPGGKIEKYLGNLNFFFIRETTSLREEGGLSGFVHSFVTEILAIVRAHVTALGGNAMVAYFITECVLNHNLHKNQGQCLINVGGDVVYVTYFTEDH